MAVDNLSLVLHGKQDLRLDQRPVPEPDKGEVQVAIHSVGICGTDVKFWQSGSVGEYEMVCPTVMGHEPSGIVTKLGEGVTSLKVGDRVALEPGVPCRMCRLCKGGRYNLCPDIKYCATPPDHGTLSRYFVHPHDFCFKLPDHVSLEEGAMLQSLAIGVHACRRAGIKLGDTVLICGAGIPGPIGMMCMMTAKVQGATQIVVTDVKESRLQHARSLGADHTVLAGDPHQTAEDVRRALGEDPAVTIECSGAVSSISTAMIYIPEYRNTVKEVSLSLSLAMVSSGQVDLKQLITHRFKLEQSMETFQAALRREGIKIIINCQKE